MPVNSAAMTTGEWNPTGLGWSSPRGRAHWPGAFLCPQRALLAAGGSSPAMCRLKVKGGGGPAAGTSAPWGSGTQEASCLHLQDGFS